MIKKHLSLSKNEEVAIRRLKEVLSEKFSLLDFRIFGSKARGDDTPESDIDVMIEIDESNPDIESQMDDIIFKINIENDTLISATFFTKKELDEGPMSESPIYKVIQKEGISI